MNLEKIEVNLLENSKFTKTISYIETILSYLAYCLVNGDFFAGGNPNHSG